MRLLSCLVTTSLLLAADAGALKALGPPCPEGDGLYAVGCNQHYFECVNGREFQRVCPGNLYFDQLLARCEQKADNILCDRKGRRTLQVRQKAGDIVCKEDGDFAVDATTCNTYYYQCANGRFFGRRCPWNQRFDPVTKRCGYGFDCDSRDVKLFPGEAHAAPTYDHDNNEVTAFEVEEESLEAPKGVSCSALGDATISKTTCSPYFWQCANGKLFRKTCPKGLVYVLSQNMCDFPHSVKECPEYDGTETAYESYAPPTTTEIPIPTTDLPYVTQQYDQYAPPPQSPQILPHPEVSTDCDNKADGFYEISNCHWKFLTCSNGRGRVIECAHNLVYDARVNACDFLEACQGPRKQEDVPPLHNHGGALDNKPKDIKVDFDCNAKEDGHYVKEACTQNYFRCSDRRAFALKCPADLVFNKATGTCDFASNCEKNYMEPTQVYTTQAPTTVEYTHPTTKVYSRPVYTTTTTTTTAPTTTTVAYEEPSTTTQAYAQTYTTEISTTPQILDDFSCINLDDGNFASGICKNIFYTCSHRQLTATKCPSTLVFNPYLGQCDYPANVPDCRGQDTLVQYAQTTTEAPTTPSYAPVYAPVATQPPKYAAFCERLADGNYGKKCETHFYQCANFETTLVNCPAGLFYDLKADKCDHPENVEGCPGYIPTTPAPTTAASPTEAYNPSYTDYTTTTQGPVATTPISETFSCSGRADGIYALPYCSKDYVQCIMGRSLLASCAAGLFYSEQSGLCDYKANVAICKHRQGADIIASDACVGKSDGYYSAGCSSHYFSCIGEQIRKMTCPNKLKFSEKKGTCEYPTNVEECGISVQPQNAPPVVPSDFCTRRANGLHSFAKCSPNYVVCDNAIAIAGTCATPLVFNEANQLCDYRNNNKECGSEYVSTTTSGYYNGYVTVPATTTKAYEAPSTTTDAYVAPTTTTKAYQPPVTTTKAYEAPTTTTKPYQPPTTTTKAYEAPTTTTQAYVTVPTTTTKAYEAPTTTTPEYVTVPTTTTEAPTTTLYTTTTTSTTTTTTTEAPTTTTPAEDVPSTTDAYQPPSTTTPADDVPTSSAPIEYTTSHAYLKSKFEDWTQL